MRSPGGSRNWGGHNLPNADNSTGTDHGAKPFGTSGTGSFNAPSAITTLGGLLPQVPPPITFEQFVQNVEGQIRAGISCAAFGARFSPAASAALGAICAALPTVEQKAREVANYLQRLGVQV